MILGQSSWSIATSGSNSPLPPLNDQRMGLLLETALLRAPLVHIKAGRWMEAITRYRTVLRVTESSATQTLRLTFARQLAEILLRRMCQANYIPPSSSSSNNKVILTSKNIYIYLNLIVCHLDYTRCLETKAVFRFLTILSKRCSRRSSTTSPNQ